MGGSTAARTPSTSGGFPCCTSKQLREGPKLREDCASCTRRRARLLPVCKSEWLCTCDGVPAGCNEERLLRGIWHGSTQGNVGVPGVDAWRGATFASASCCMCCCCCNCNGLMFSASSARKPSRQGRAPSLDMGYPDRWAPKEDFGDATGTRNDPAIAALCGDATGALDASSIE